MPLPERKEDGMTTTSIVLPFVYILAFLYPTARVVSSLVQEKETRVKECMRMMGMYDYTLWTSWYITYAVMFLIQSALVTIVLSTVVNYSDISLIFLFFWLFGIAMIGFCAVVSTFFSRVKSAGTMAYVAIFAAFIPYMVVSGDQYSFSARFWSCLLPPTAMGMGTLQIHRTEGFFVGVTLTNMYEEIGGFTFGTALWMLVFDAVFYTLLALYLDKVVPSEYGTRLHPLFFLQASFWKGTASADVNDPAHMDEAAGDGAPFEKNAPNLVKAVSIRHLKKTFGDFNAVDDLDLDIFEGQIFALLGHNGAGKSTTINMLTGLLSVSSGSALISGKDVATDMMSIRRNIGVCPQHDVLYNDLTVKEHFLLFAALRGIEPSEVRVEIRQKIIDVGLTEKLNTLAGSLSGGQKRKLSVALALLGNSKVVFLDEPTSGMDPYSRRATWDLLRKNRKGRAIVLTTHFMDEADILGDRIAIMAEGKVKCCGSSYFLKSQVCRCVLLIEFQCRVSTENPHFSLCLSFKVLFSKRPHPQPVRYRLHHGPDPRQPPERARAPLVQEPRRPGQGTRAQGFYPQRHWSGGVFPHVLRQRQVLPPGSCPLV